MIRLNISTWKRYAWTDEMFVKQFAVCVDHHVWVDSHMFAGLSIAPRLFRKCDWVLLLASGTAFDLGCSTYPKTANICGSGRRQGP